MKLLTTLVLCGCLLLIPSQSNGQTKERTIARLFWQDASDNSLRWGDLRQGEKWSLIANKIAGFPALDQEKLSFVQMQAASQLLITGIHDTEDGKFRSGWVAIESGVTQEAHGDHFHWHYPAMPSVRLSQLDDQQGNPAHVYTYDGNFYLANDKKDGITVVSPSELRTGAKGRFFSAGGGHITIAAIGNRVCYATWIDRDGDNLGRIDVIGLDSAKSKGYSFNLPSGGIHGATANSGKLFFAPADGICWVAADLELTKNAKTVDVNHLTLGTDAQDKPKRTGAFINHRNFVLFTTGRGESTELCVLDAASPKPTVNRLALKAKEGNSLTSPVCMRTRTGEDVALLFEENAAGEVGEQLHVIELDSNRDGNLDDAKLVRSIDVGKSLIDGHSGHHELTPLGNRAVAFTNPGDGTIWVVSTSDWSVQSKLQVGGTPTRVLSVGGN